MAGRGKQPELAFLYRNRAEIERQFLGAGEFAGRAEKAGRAG